MALFAKTAAVLTLACSALSGTAFADTYHHIDQLAVTVERQARQLEREMSAYRFSPEYGHLLADSRRLSRVAAHLHEVAHDRGCLAHLEADVRQLEWSFQHLESTLEHVEENRFYGHCRLSGSTLHVRRLMHSVELNIHHLRDDIRSLSRIQHHSEHRNAVRPLGRVDTRFYQPLPTSRSRGITIGGGSSRFTIRF